MDQRSGCPINLSMELFGDRWTLIILRDVMFGNRRSYRDILTHSVEGIASNILVGRLKMLVDEGLLTRAADPGHKQRSVYSLTEKAIQLVPVLVHLGAWGRRHLAVSAALSLRAGLLEEGGPPMWDAFMQELREIHLGVPRIAEGPSVRDRLQAAYSAFEAEAAGGAAGVSRTSRSPGP